MKYFLDTEFIEDGVTIDLISIGIVCEDGREFYAENLDADLSKASDWVKENVIKHLWSKQKDKAQFNALSRDGVVGGLLHHREIAKEVGLFCSLENYGKPDFWAYYASYDWVAFCQLFGTIMDLPKGFPTYCQDIKQECIRLGDRELPKHLQGQHNALVDSKWCKHAYEFLQNFVA